MENTEHKTNADAPSKTYFDTEHQRFLFTDEEMARQRAELRLAMKIFKEESLKRGFIINPIQM